MDELKQWKCKRGHVLGVVQRVKVDGFHVSRLMLFRHAIDLDENAAMADVDVIGTVEGIMEDIKCDVPGCNMKRTWHLGVDVVEKVVGTYVAE